jgi:hypothetical protein
VLDVKKPTVIEIRTASHRFLSRLATTKKRINEHADKLTEITHTRKRSPSTLLMGMLISTAIMENSMEGHQKTKNRTAI